jgi:hypothetical protein
MYTTKSILLCLALGFASVAYAALNPITVRVEQKNKTQSDGPKTTQSRSLKVLLANSSKQDYSALNVKYFLFARDVESKNLVLLEKGERPADLKGMNTATVETPEVNAQFTDEHSTGGRKFGTQASSGGSSNFAKGKKVEAAGQKIVGYAVQVFDKAGKLMGEAYEPLSMKEQVSKAAGAAAATPR